MLAALGNVVFLAALSTHLMSPCTGVFSPQWCCFHCLLCTCLYMITIYLDLERAMAFTWTPRISCTMLPSNPSTSASETEVVVIEERERCGGE